MYSVVPRPKCSKNVSKSAGVTGLGDSASFVWRLQTSDLERNIGRSRIPSSPSASFDSHILSGYL